MRKIFVLLPLLIFLCGCVNNYCKFYTDLTKGKNILDNPDFIIPTETPQLIQGYNVEKDSKSMEEDGYWCIGFSSFNAAEINQNDSIKQAKNIHASKVIVYSAYTNTVSGSMPVTFPTTQTSYHSGSVYGMGGGFANYSGTTTTYGSSTTYMPYSIRRYDYYATYWIKRKPPRLGINCTNLSDELRRKLESNKGVYINVVVKDSPAFNNDIISGDVLLRVNGQEINDTSHFQKLFAEISDPFLELEIFRNGKTIIKKVQLQN